MIVGFKGKPDWVTGIQGEGWGGAEGWGEPGQSQDRVPQRQRGRDHRGGGGERGQGDEGPGAKQGHNTGLRQTAKS